MNAILVCLVAALCTVQIADVRGDNLNVLKAQLAKAKQEVDNSVNRLTRAKNNLYYDLNTRLYNVKFPAMETINSIVNPAMEEIRSAGKAANEGGKNADDCVESGRLALREISQTAFSSLDSCQSAALQLIVPVQNRMEATITDARKLTNELDAIFLNCYSSNILEMQSCVAIALGKANTSIRSLKSTAEVVISSGTAESGSAFNGGAKCIRDVVSAARPKIPKALASAKECISKV
ncbi:hypothetical protein KPH14_006226 [Odynerus spinipes]|uniref:Uncharacterized protein n=1 Tax=Odynerus spinipes TaxID=1348599 RepID=A0AAD9VMW8_9HYME|nr:hypothetical protein KPH14_006226 [Odynerus spinipes]